MKKKNPLPTSTRPEPFVFDECGWSTYAVFILCIIFYIILGTILPTNTYAQVSTEIKKPTLEELRTKCTGELQREYFITTPFVLYIYACNDTGHVYYFQNNTWTPPTLADDFMIDPDIAMYKTEANEMRIRLQQKKDKKIRWLNIYKKSGSIFRNVL